MNKRMMVLMVGLALGGCDRTYGSGRATADSRALGEFDAVEVSAGLVAKIWLGAQEVIVRGDDNIVPFVRTTVENRRLRIEPARDLEPVVPLEISVRVPSLRAAALRAGGRLSLIEVEAEELALSVEAGGDLEASGNIDRLSAQLAAGGTLDAGAMAAQSVNVHGRGGGLLLVTALDEVTGSVESGAEVRVFGHPLRRSVETESGGEVHYF